MTGPSGLQFDKVEGGGSMTCVMCKSSITDAYFQLNGRPICASCKAKADAQIADIKARGTSPGAMSKAVVYGIGAAIAGAIVYFAVAAYAHLEIGIIAVAIGYMVGSAMRKATGGVGGRRYQIIAVVLTYLSVAGAYAALGMHEVAANSQLTSAMITQVARDLAGASAHCGVQIGCGRHPHRDHHRRRTHAGVANDGGRRIQDQRAVQDRGGAARRDNVAGADTRSAERHALCELWDGASAACPELRRVRHARVRGQAEGACAATAERATAAGDLGAARAAWENALRWLPQGSTAVRRDPAARGGPHRRRRGAAGTQRRHRTRDHGGSAARPDSSRSSCWR